MFSTMLVQAGEGSQRPRMQVIPRHAVHGGNSTIHQGSGKNPAGNKVGPFEGNPHDQPGANGK
jgi:hypothetical protein